MITIKRDHIVKIGDSVLYDSGNKEECGIILDIALVPNGVVDPELVCVIYAELEGGKRVEATSDKFRIYKKTDNKSAKEELFLSIIEDYTIKENRDEYPNSVFYLNKKGKELFQLNKKYSELWCDWDLVWEVFYLRYGMDYHEIRSFIRDMVEKHFKLKNVIVCKSL